MAWKRDNEHETHSADMMEMSASARPTVRVNFEKYLPYFEDENISEEAKRELIETLWEIMLGFVDLRFGIHPLQQACGKVAGKAGFPASDGTSEVNSASCDHTSGVSDEVGAAPDTETEG